MSMQCFCSNDREMKRLARCATEYTDHGFSIYWCPSCGRIVMKNHLDDSEMWDRPEVTRNLDKMVEAADFELPPEVRKEIKRRDRMEKKAREEEIRVD